MEILGFIAVLTWFMLDSVICIKIKRKYDTIQSFSRRSGEPIAIDNLIQKYEREHQKLCNDERRNGIVNYKYSKIIGDIYSLNNYFEGALLMWPDLDNKNLTNYCKKYLQHSVPRRTNDEAIGTISVRELNYLKENRSITNRIVVIQCKVLLQPLTTRFHYVTRALKPNCVYALDRRKDEKLCLQFNIINEHCDFEDNPLIIRPLKRKRMEIIGTVHQRTGQPIAKDKWLLQYELEHKDLLMKEGNEGKNIEWPYAMAHYNLDLYCNKYMRELVPLRNINGIRGILKTEKLYYRKFNSNMYVHVAAVTCMTTNASKLHYYMTRAPESNCVFALLRQGHNPRDPLVIIFKHCDFEEPSDIITNLQNKDILDKNVIPKIEVKEEVFDTMVTREIFPKD